jgi:hypothetical protein
VAPKIVLAHGEKRGFGSVFVSKPCEIYILSRSGEAAHTDFESQTTLYDPDSWGSLIKTCEQALESDQSPKPLEVEARGAYLGFEAVCESLKKCCSRSVSHCRCFRGCSLRDSSLLRQGFVNHLESPFAAALRFPAESWDIEPAACSRLTDANDHMFRRCSSTRDIKERALR